MRPTEPLSDAAVAAVADAIFAKPGAVVVKKQSRYLPGQRRFADAADLVAFATGNRGPYPHDNLHLWVYYPDTGGRLVQEASVDVRHPRLADDGWGLISVYLHLFGTSVLGSFASANSRKRAEKWALTYSDWDPPDTWDWKAVASHERRIARALRLATIPSP